VLGVFANRLVLCHRQLRADKPVTDAEEIRWRVEQCLKDAEVSACLVWLGSEGLREHNHPHAVRMVHQFSRVDGSCLKRPFAECPTTVSFPEGTCPCVLRQK
jgi:hypothetical protein